MSCRFRQGRKQAGQGVYTLRGAWGRGDTTMEWEHSYTINRYCRNGPKAKAQIYGESLTRSPLLLPLLAALSVSATIMRGHSCPVHFIDIQDTPILLNIQSCVRFILRWWLLEAGYRLGPNERSHSLTRLIRADFPAPRTNVHRPENIAEHSQGYRQLTGRNEKGAPQVMSQIRSQAGCGRLGATHTV